MNAIKEIALSVSVSSAIISAFYIICPDGNMSKQMKYIISLLMLFAILTPLVSVNITFPKTEQKTVAWDMSAAQEMAESQYEYIAKSALEEAEIFYDRIYINTDILEDGNIDISKVCVFGVKEKEKAYVALSKYFEKVEFLE